MSEGGSALKRVRISSTVEVLEKEFNDGKGSDENSDQNEFEEVNSNDVFQIAFVCRAGQLGELSSQDPIFRTNPLFTHQIFTDQIIQGYRGLCIEWYLSCTSLRSYLSIKYDAKSDNAVDIRSSLMQFIDQDSLVDSLDDLQNYTATEKALDYLEDCEEIDSFQIDNRRFVVYYEKCLANNELLRMYHRRMQFLMFLNIEGASYITDSDSRWKLFVLMEKTKKNGFQFVGYTTVYSFLTTKWVPASSMSASHSALEHGFLERDRISQVLISPVYQGRGLGCRLLSVVYKMLRSGDCIEITVEDPSPGFRSIRDIQDFRDVLHEGFLTKELRAIDSIEMEYPKTEWIKSVHEKLKLTYAQIRRVYELELLRNVDASDTVMYKKFRLFIKRALWNTFADVLETFSPEDKKVKLSELYADAEEEYRKILKRLVREDTLTCRFNLD